jgi:RimJ/RimL family protein N-acetyltransferase
MSRKFELRTERLTIRMLGRDDITEFVRYRNVETVARYQDWDLPFTRDAAHELVDELEQFDGPTPGTWVQLAIERTDTHPAQLAGDIAVWISPDGWLAMLGYTLAPEHQGNGMATEAVAAVVEFLFSDASGYPELHRIAATLDPANGASARVLEACGFRYEGTAIAAASVRGAWADDARFALLRHEWNAWKARPTNPPKSFELFVPTHADVGPLLAVQPAFSQRQMVAPVGASFGEALIPEIRDGQPVVAWYRGIRADGELVGFVMVAEPHPTEPHPYLWRLVIARQHQLRGIGRQAVLAVAAHWHAGGATHLKVSFVPDLPGNPRRFYEKLGFEPTGVVDDGEVEAILDLSKLPA